MKELLRIGWKKNKIVSSEVFKVETVKFFSFSSFMRDIEEKGFIGFRGNESQFLWLPVYEVSA